MMPTHARSIRCIFFFCIFIVHSALPDSNAPAVPADPATDGTSNAAPVIPRRINDIIVIGNKTTDRDAILNYIPYQIGEIFNPQKSGQLIRNLYQGLKRFRNITLKADYLPHDMVNLYIIVEEKPPLKDVIFKGNTQVPEKEIEKKVTFRVPAVDPEELKIFAEQMKKLYYERGYQNVKIDTSLEIGEDGKAVATFTFDEGKKSRIRRIMFDGNKYISDKELKNVLFTREEWLLSIIDRTGTFHPDRLEADKHMIEQYYQNHGFMQAKVTDIKVDVEPGTNILNLTFFIEEGDLYTISEVKAPGNDVVSEEFLLANIPIRPGDVYSREMVANTIKMMEYLWGNLGYIFAHIEPGVQVDDDTKTVSISFMSDIGKQIRLNRIAIKGNQKTRDKVIRRRLSLREGGLITQGQMEASKNSVTNLGYFEQQDGVNWKIRRIGDDEADLDLIVREAKTGHANLQLGFGGAGVSMNSPASGVTAKVSVSDTNLFGTGTVVNLEGSWSKEEQSLLFHLGQAWLFDKPISGALDVYHKRPSYDQLRNVRSAINSKVTGGAITAGFITPPSWHILNNSQFLFSLGVDSVRYERPPVPSVDPRLLPKSFPVQFANEQYSKILVQEFVPGDYVWVANNIEQDKRNHPVHPSRGQKVKITTRIAIPSLDRKLSVVDCQAVCKKIGYAKFSIDYTWFTPLINEQDLVFKIHTFFGLATPLKGHAIPFGELFHIGGDTSVRGFNYGQIGPQFLGDTIGGKKAFFLNTELIFPITQDLNLKGVLFYDGGTGWDNPYACCVDPIFITGNSFDYRHAVGVGIRMLSPMPVRVDWGFKLDPREGESANQVHFGMTYDW